MNTTQTTTIPKHDGSFAKSAFFTFFAWAACSSLAITICTLVDAVLIGNLVGSNGLAVANLSTPVFLFYGLLGMTLGIGGNVLIGKSLGGSDIQGAQVRFHNLVWMGVVVSIIVAVFCVVFQHQIYVFLGARDALLPLAQAYLSHVFYAAPLFVIYHLLSLSVRTDGDPKCAAIAAAVVIITNLSLDVVFMQVFNWGIAGASRSLCIAEALGVLVLLSHFMKKHTLLTLGMQRPHWKQVRHFVSNGFGVGSAFLSQGLVMLCFNTLLLDGSDQGVLNVAVFGVLYTIGLLPGAFFDGGGNALSTVVSIFSGEKDKDSVLIVLKQAILVIGLIGIGFTVIFGLCPRQILGLFGLAQTASAQNTLQLFSLSLLLAGIHIVVTSFWQAIGRYRLAGSFSVMRNLILMLVLGCALISQYQIMGVAMTYVITELICLCTVLTTYMARGSRAYLTKSYKSVHRSFEGYYPIETESVSKIYADLETLCEEWDMSMKETFFINLIVEELILNIIKFGLDGSEKPHYVAVKLLDNNGEYILRIRDNVKTYNPFDSQGDDVDAAAMRLITTKTTYYDYQRKLIFNYLYLIL